MTLKNILKLNKLYAVIVMKDCKYKKLKKVMSEFKRKTLRSGSGPMVKKRKQALAIALAEARKNCSCKK